MFLSESKYHIYLFILFFIFSNPVYSGCGGCQINNNMNNINKKSNALIMDIPRNGEIEGFAIASCNKCNLGSYEDLKCSMGIKIKDSNYPVYGYHHNHSNSHDTDGICNALRIAYISGNINNNKFYSNSFVLIDSP